MHKTSYIFAFFIATLSLSGCAYRSFDSNTAIEPIKDMPQKLKVLVNWGNCPNFYKNVVPGGKAEVVKIMQSGLRHYPFLTTQSLSQADFKLSFNCKETIASRKTNSDTGYHEAPGYHLLSLGLIPAYMDIPDTMELRVERVGSEKIELIDRNIQESTSTNYLWWIIAAPAVWIDMFIGPSVGKQYSKAVKESVQGLLSQAINAYIFE